MTPLHDTPAPHPSTAPLHRTPPPHPSTHTRLLPQANALSTDDQTLAATVLAYCGKYQEAAKLWAKVGKVDRAIEMYSDLRMWEEAKQYSHTAGGTTAQEVVKRQAQWAEEVNDLGVAAET